MEKKEKRNRVEDLWVMVGWAIRVSLGFKKQWCGNEEDRRRNRMRLYLYELVLKLVGILGF